jgi:hypothetical protein
MQMLLIEINQERKYICLLKFDAINYGKIDAISYLLPVILSALRLSVNSKIHTKTKKYYDVSYHLLK